MVSPLGMSAEASCAALRAGLVRFFELQDRPPLAALEEPLCKSDGQPATVVGSWVRGMTDELEGQARLLALLEGATQDAAAASPEAFDGHEAIAALAVPTRHASMLTGARFCEILAKNSGREAVFQETKSFAGNETAVVLALAHVADRMAATRCRRGLVVAVDSLIEPLHLRELHQAGRLKTQDRSDGLIPSEAACVLAVEPLEEARERGAQVLVTLHGAATAEQPQSTSQALAEQVWDGHGLSAAMRQTLAASGSKPSLVVADLNGEPCRAEELGYACTRVLGGDWQLWHPANCIGATGVASAAVAIVAAARALHKGYAPCDAALVTASSYGADKAAVLLQRVAKNGEL